MTIRTLVLPLGASAALLMAATGCSLPSRSNPFDPVNSPEFEAYVLLPDGSRSVTASHAAVFTLDATANCENPAVPETCSLTFDYDLDGDLSNGFEIEGGSPLEIAVLPSNLSDFVETTAAPRTLTVREHAGSQGRASSVVIITNGAPDVDAGERDLFIAERRDGEVTLDACGGGLATCTSTDPDGDPLEFDWQLLDADGSIDVQPMDPPDLDGRRVRFVTPEDARTYVFRLTATDPYGAKSSTIVRVFVGTQVWVEYVSPLRVARLLPDRTVEAITNVDIDPACSGGGCYLRQGSLDPVTGLRMLSVSGVNIVIEHALDADIAAETRWVIAGESTSIAAWGGVTLGVVSEPAGRRLYVYRPGGALEEVVLGGGEEPWFVARAGTTGGEFWVATDGSVHRVDANAIPATSAAVSPIFEHILDIAPAREGGLWVLDGGTGMASVAYHVSEPGALRAYRSLGPNGAGIDGPSGIAAGPDGKAWVSSPGAMFLVGSSGDPVSSPAGELPAFATSSFPPDGSVWTGSVAGGGPAIHVRAGDELELDGIIRVTDFEVPGVPELYGWVDLDTSPFTGEVLATGTFNYDTSVLVTQPLHLAVTAELPFLIPTRGFTPNRERGIWVSTDVTVIRATSDFRELARYEAPDAEILSTAPDGSGGAWVALRDDSLDSEFGIRHLDADAVVAGADITFPPVSVQLPPNAFVEPSGLFLSLAHAGSLCAMSQNAEDDDGQGGFTLFEGAVFRIDLDAGTATPLTPSPRFIHPFVAIAPDGACWYGDDYQTTGRVFRVAAGQTVAVETPLGALEQVQGIAVDPRDSSLFVRHTTGISHVSTAGVLTELTGVPAGSGGSIGTSDRCDDPGAKECLDLWFSAGDLLYRARLSGFAIDIQDRFELPLAGPAEIQVLPGNGFPQ